MLLDFRKAKNTRLAAHVFLRFSQVSQHPGCLDHVIQTRKTISLRELFLLVAFFSVTKALEKLKTIEGQITDKDLQDNKEGNDFLSNVSEASAYQMREGRMLSTQNSNEREPSAASQIYNELKRSYTSLVENVAPSAEEADREYHKVKY